MRQLFQLLGDTLKKKEDAVLVTVVASSGSTPRGAGARMLVTKDGRIGGTIGGGAVEYQCEQRAKDVLDKKSSHVEKFFLHQNEIQDIGMICGGDVSVYFQYISANNQQMMELTEKIESLYVDGEVCWLIYDITEGSVGDMAIYGKKTGLSGMDVPDDVLNALNTKPVQVDSDGQLYYCEKLVQSGIVYIFGGGHVAQALVPDLAAVDFRCVVLEDRAEFCRTELFPGVIETRMIDNRHIKDYVDIKEEDYICVMTRGHKDDTAVQAQILKTPAHYIGVIGSRKKTVAVFAKLKEEGFTDEDLARITTPIGLDILAETPAEIAVSITAQLIKNRAERTVK